MPKQSLELFRISSARRGVVERQVKPPRDIREHVPIRSEPVIQQARWPLVSTAQ